jgi:dTDP-4-dehydrorhamnose 3,5-epimerase
MKFQKLHIPQAMVIDPEPRKDTRGMLARAFCAREMAEHGLQTTFVQTNITYNYVKGTVRGLHWQVLPMGECKLVRCTRGAVYDVLVDMRPDSPTYLQHFAVELTEHNRRMLYVPEMCAHGYQALTDDAEVTYMVSGYYSPESERGILYNDPAIGIEWPLPATVVSEKDQSWQMLSIEMGAPA